MKFKVGDGVKVVDSGKSDAQRVNGMIGTVVLEGEWDVNVRFPGFHGGNGDDRNEWYVYPHDLIHVSMASSEPSKPNPMIGLGGAPTRATTLPEDAKERKKFPIASGVLDYFPDALVAIAQVSWRGNEQHNPGQPLHWARGKSGDQDDTIIRHFMQRGTFDSDGQRHSAKLAWRALALLQLEIEAEQGASNGGSGKA